MFGLINWNHFNLLVLDSDSVAASIVSLNSGIIPPGNVEEHQAFEAQNELDIDDGPIEGMKQSGRVLVICVSE